MWSLEFCLFSRKIKHLSEGDDLLLYMWHTMSTSFLSFSDSASSEANIRHCLRGEQWETIEFLFSEMCTVNLKHARISRCCKKFIFILLWLPNSSALICNFCPSNSDRAPAVLVFAKKCRVKLLVWCLPLAFHFSHIGSRQDLLLICFKSLGLIL